MLPRSRPLDANALRGLLRYSDGKLYWLARPRAMFTDERSFSTWNSRFAGAEAFTANHSQGYRVGRLMGRTLFAHRVIWALHFGDHLGGEIDHINGDRSDNRLENLRAVTRDENRLNVKKPITNKSGVVGVSPVGLSWQATIQRNGKHKYLGRFKTFDQAVAARRAAEDRMDFHPNHGRR